MWRVKVKRSGCCFLFWLLQGSQSQMVTSNSPLVFSRALAITLSSKGSPPETCLRYLWAAKPAWEGDKVSSCDNGLENGRTSPEILQCFKPCLDCTVFIKSNCFCNHGWAAATFKKSYFLLICLLKSLWPWIIHSQLRWNWGT